MAEACTPGYLGEGVVSCVSTRVTHCEHGNVFLLLLDAAGSVRAVAGFDGATALTLGLAIIQAAGAHVTIAHGVAADAAVH